MLHEIIEVEYPGCLNANLNDSDVFAYIALQLFLVDAKVKTNRLITLLIKLLSR